MDKKLGEHGLGVVYKAKLGMLKRPAAVLFTKPDVAAQQLSINEVEHDVHLSACLTHWNTVRFYDFGQTSKFVEPE